MSTINELSGGSLAIYFLAHTRRCAGVRLEQARSCLFLQFRHSACMSPRLKIENKRNAAPQYEQEADPVLFPMPVHPAKRGLRGFALLPAMRRGFFNRSLQVRIAQVDPEENALS